MLENAPIGSAELLPITSDAADGSSGKWTFLASSSGKACRCTVKTRKRQGYACNFKRSPAPQAPPWRALRTPHRIKALINRNVLEKDEEKRFVLSLLKDNVLLIKSKTALAEFELAVAF